MISKLCYWISKIPKDKILHFFISYLILDINISLCEHFCFKLWLVLLLSIIVTSGFIFGKEAIDKKKFNDWSWYDIIASYLGVITKLGLYLLMIL